MLISFAFPRKVLVDFILAALFPFKFDSTEASLAFTKLETKSLISSSIHQYLLHVLLTPFSFLDGIGIFDNPWIRTKLAALSAICL